MLRRRRERDDIPPERFVDDPWTWIPGATDRWPEPIRQPRRESEHPDRTPLHIDGPYGQ